MARVVDGEHQHCDALLDHADGAALFGKREHGTIEHVPVIPITRVEIMLAKVWSIGLVVLAAAFGGLALVVLGVLRVPIEGSL